MDARDDIDFWGVTAHKAIDPNPFPGATGMLPLHIQSHWIAVRKRCSRRSSSSGTGRTCRSITSYDESILQHESKFTQHFSDRGFRFVVAFDPDRYPSIHPVFENAVLMLEDRCPILKRRIFFHEPTYLERNAILGKRVMEQVASDRLSDGPDLAQRRPLGRAADPVHQHVDAVGHPRRRQRLPTRPAAADLRARAHLLRGHDRRDDGLDRQHPGALRPRRDDDDARTRRPSIDGALEKYGLPSVDVRVVGVQPGPGRERLHHRPAGTS